jgi:hypothetical protein
MFKTLILAATASIGITMAAPHAHAMVDPDADPSACKRILPDLRAAYGCNPDGTYNGHTPADVPAAPWSHVVETDGTVTTLPAADPYAAYRDENGNIPIPVYDVEADCGGLSSERSLNLCRNEEQASYDYLKGLWLTIDPKNIIGCARATTHYGNVLKDAASQIGHKQTVEWYGYLKNCIVHAENNDAGWRNLNQSVPFHR